METTFKIWTRSSASVLITELTIVSSIVYVLNKFLLNGKLELLYWLYFHTNLPGFKLTAKNFVGISGICSSTFILTYLHDTCSIHRRMSICIYMCVYTCVICVTHISIHTHTHIYNSMCMHMCAWCTLKNEKRNMVLKYLELTHKLLGFN